MGISLGSSSYVSHELSVSAPVVQQTFEAAPAYSAPAQVLSVEAPAVQYYSAPAIAPLAQSSY